MDSGVELCPSYGAITAMQTFLSAFDAVPDPRASNARHDLGELLVIAFLSVLCGSTSWGLMPEVAGSYALMSVFNLLDTMRLPHWRGMVKVCSLCRRWRRLAEPSVIMLSSAGWLPPDHIRRGIASL